ncbi:PR5-like receptor kinase [Neltuma alba]|uniref:PR5-like receptor kinase n=1 Tax=Neltuma alba TaxID=207710 RepID=UPI0010A3FD49|nr:PR5-like receptor kinase [Prosopis alba]
MAANKAMAAQEGYLDPNDPSLSWERLLQIAKRIAKGLEYLHSGCNPQTLHFDIKPNNIFLDKSFYPKISDSGQAKLCSRTHSTVSVPGARGTAGYIALKIWNRNFGGASHKSEVFSYGMLILKMAGGRQDINGEGSDSSDKYFPHFVYKQIAVDKNITEHDDMMLGLWCVRTMPSDRPVMSRVIEVLKGSLEQLSILPKPSIFSPTPQLADLCKYSDELCGSPFSQFCVSVPC